MDHNDREHFAPDVANIARRLRAERPTATRLLLEEVRLRVERGGPEMRGAPRPKGAFLRSRLAVTLMAVLGLAMGGTGATLAAEGISGNGGAGTAQYGERGEDGVGGEQEQGGVGGERTSDVLGGGGGGGRAGQGQAAAQAAADGGERLAFTGYLAVPLLAGGVALLVTGAVLRRKTRDD
jgi:hypothetical protein